MHDDLGRNVVSASGSPTTTRVHYSQKQEGTVMTTFEVIILVVFMFAGLVAMLGVLGQGIELGIRDQRTRFAARRRDGRQDRWTVRGGHA